MKHDLKYIELLSVCPVILYRVLKGESVLVLPDELNLFTLNFLKKHINYQCTILSCISGVDYLDGNYRYSVVYDILSVVLNFRLRLKVFLNETTFLHSIISSFKCANWWEREVWDFFGLYFKNHSDFRRILTDYGFEGHPMRKDFPLSGYTEVYYSEIRKRIVLDRLQLAQDFRVFAFDRPF